MLAAPMPVRPDEDVAIANSIAGDLDARLKGLYQKRVQLDADIAALEARILQLVPEKPASPQPTRRSRR